MSETPGRILKGKLELVMSMGFKNAKVYTEKFHVDSSGRKIYEYPFALMIAYQDRIEIPVSTKPEHKYGRQKVMTRLRVQAHRMGVDLAIYYMPEEGKIVAMKVYREKKHKKA